jgi:tRNA 2-thiouridine synthesizing protein A
MTVLDVKGLKCPLPVLRAKRALNAVAPGEVLEVEATDAAALKDFPAFCAMTGHELVETRTEGSAGSQVYRFLIRRKSE